MSNLRDCQSPQHPNTKINIGMRYNYNQFYIISSFLPKKLKPMKHNPCMYLSLSLLHLFTQKKMDTDWSFHCFPSAWWFFTYPSEKYDIVKMGIISPNNSGWKSNKSLKIFEKLPTQKNLPLMPNQTVSLYVLPTQLSSHPTPRGFLWHFLHHAVEFRGWGLVEARCLLQSHRTNPKPFFSFGRWNGGHAVGVVFIIRFGKGGPLLKGSKLGIIW